MAMNDDWKNDPKLKEIDKTKLDMLQNLAEKGNGISAVLEVMKAGKTPQEASKIDRIVNLMRMIH